jgi:hypothetical protein
MPIPGVRETRAMIMLDEIELAMRSPYRPFPLPMFAAGNSAA